MKKYLLLTRSNAKKSKSQMRTIIALILLASIFLNVWLVLSLNYSANYGKRSDELNSEQSLVSFSAADDEFKVIVEEALNGDERVADYEITEILFSSASLKYSAGTISTDLSIFSKNDASNKQIGKYKFLDDQDDFTEETVFVPYLFKTGGGYNIGDRLDIVLEQKNYSFIVGGFFENMLTGSFNGGNLAIVIHDQTLQKMKDELSLESLSISVKLGKGLDDKKFTSSFVENISAKRLVPYNAVWQSLSRQARTFISEIIGSIIALVAFLLTLIVLIVIAFNISNRVEEDMKNLGVLKGIGYKSKQIVLSILLQFVAVAIVSSIVGIALSYALMPLISNLLATQTGIIWQYGFCLIPSLITASLIGLVVALICTLSARKIKNISPMTALRDGIENHNFKKNSIPLEKTKLNLHLALGSKSLSRNKKQNISISIIVMILTSVAMFAGGLYNHIAIDTDKFIKTVGGEYADAGVVVSAEHSQEVVDALKADADIEKVYMFSSNTVYVNDTDIMGDISNDFSDLNNQTIVYAGRFPEHENEVALGGYFAKANSLKVGDMIALRYNKAEAEFLITGLTQSTNYMGEDCMLTTAGFARIGDLLYETYYFNIAEGASINQVIASIESTLDGKILRTINIEELIAGFSQVYINMISILAIAAILIILLVIFLVLYLMVKTFVLKRRTELGILKALGYTTHQLVAQTILSFLPTMLMGVTLGTVLGIFISNPLFTVLLSSVGIMKAMFTIPTLTTAAISVGIILFSLAVTFLVSRRIRKITPNRLLLGN